VWADGNAHENPSPTPTSWDGRTPPTLVPSADPLVARAGDGVIVSPVEALGQVLQRVGRQVRGTVARRAQRRCRIITHRAGRNGPSSKGQRPFGTGLAEGGMEGREGRPLLRPSPTARPNGPTRGVGGRSPIPQRTVPFAEVVLGARVVGIAVGRRAQPQRRRKLRVRVIRPERDLTGPGGKGGRAGGEGSPGIGCGGRERVMIPPTYVVNAILERILPPTPHKRHRYTYRTGLTSSFQRSSENRRRSHCGHRSRPGWSRRSGTCQRPKIHQ
jgi:hypothetical protein